MLQDYLSLKDAITFLKKETDYPWTTMGFLQLVKDHGSTLHAIPDDDSVVEVSFYDKPNSNPLCKRIVVWDMAILESSDLEELMMKGETTAKYAIDNGQLIFDKLPEINDLKEYEYFQTKVFAKPVHVNLETVRVSKALLEHIATGKIAWSLELSKQVDLKKSTHTKSESTHPWLESNPNDPEPVQQWYTPARYFARQLILKDPTLLTKRELLSAKIADSLTGVGIYKRGGKKSLSASTVKKALSNVIFH